MLSTDRLGEKSALVINWPVLLPPSSIQNENAATPTCRKSNHRGIIFLCIYHAAYLGQPLCVVSVAGPCQEGGTTLNLGLELSLRRNLVAGRLRILITARYGISWCSWMMYCRYEGIRGRKVTIVNDALSGEERVRSCSGYLGYIPTYAHHNFFSVVSGTLHSLTRVCTQ